MMDQRCTECGKPGHKRGAHELYPKLSSKRGLAVWFVWVVDVSGAINGWCGPLPWSVAVAVARRWDVNLTRRSRTYVRRWSRCLSGCESLPMPHGWRDYDPVSTNRVRRLQPATHKKHLAARRAA